MKSLALTSTLILMSAPAFAQDMASDAEAGEAEFGRQCVTCHVVANEEGEVLAGRNGKIGPNLFEVIGRAPGAVEDFRYSDALVAYGESDAVWEIENTVAYLQDPTGFLREEMDDARARSKMTYQVRDEQAANDIVAYLATFSPEDVLMEADGDEAEGDAAEGDMSESDMTDGAEAEGDEAAETESEAESGN